ncbi:BMP family ABC transporter substrate-binding protein [Metabacillus arenae]|uniref:BMP family ABC transporter substrate-binding protein n=1 Tax=Metabacillus arenae TaxID=2771434 RepID=A0A926NSA7_9BACI|nr:BMP family ABC transporter substrate-binding protein [Metabacillus arenae]MBD1383037.1 BMP family ABC transporter substrate-binding protein [Metabacillus arenae]
MAKRLIFIFLCLFLLSGCGQPSFTGKLEKVGLLVPETISDQVWGTKGYKGLLTIQSKFNVDVFYKEGMDNRLSVEKAVDDFHQKGVNLVFGHGSEYESFFKDISKKYPDIHFVFFNGDAKGENVTSLNFEAHSMGFFGGMVAGEMTKTRKVGVIASFEWQPEVDGFREGAHYQNDQVDVEVKYVKHWDDIDAALKILDQMIVEGVDVVYPAGDGYNVPVIERLKEEGLYAIGFISDQSDLGEGTVLTSTIQDVDKLYELVAQQYNKGSLKSGELSFDFSDNVIELGEFSPHVDEEFKQKIMKDIDTFRKTKKLPNEL